MTMQEFMEKKRKTAAVLKTWLPLLFAAIAGAYVAVFTLVEQPEHVLYLSLLLLCIATGWWCAFVFYIAQVLPLLRCMRDLEQRGIDYDVYNIDLRQPSFPQTTVYCGQRALLCKKPQALIVPYADILWAYLYERKVYGITVEQKVVVYTKQGKRFWLDIKSDQFQMLLTRFVQKEAPNVILGYGAEQKARYRQVCPQFVQAKKRVKRFWGIVLMLVGKKP